jgi:hypothetical protein
MAPRLDLQILLEEIVDHVYFQPPPNDRMEFPCIVYQRDGSSAIRADNKLYRHTKRYQVTVIDRNPDSELPDKVIELPLSEFNRFFTADGLNHHVFTLFF